MQVWPARFSCIKSQFSRPLNVSQSLWEQQRGTSYSVHCLFWVSLTFAKLRCSVFVQRTLSGGVNKVFLLVSKFPLLEGIKVLILSSHHMTTHLWLLSFHGVSHKDRITARRPQRACQVCQVTEVPSHEPLLKPSCALWSRGYFIQRAPQDQTSKPRVIWGHMGWVTPHTITSAGINADPDVLEVSSQAAKARKNIGWRWKIPWDYLYQYFRRRGDFAGESTSLCWHQLFPDKPFHYRKLFYPYQKKSKQRQREKSKLLLATTRH